MNWNSSAIGMVQLIEGASFLSLVKLAVRHLQSSLKVDLKWVSNLYQIWSGIPRPHGTSSGSRAGRQRGSLLLLVLIALLWENPIKMPQ